MENVVIFLNKYKDWYFNFMANEIFQDYYKRLAKEGVLRSFLWALTFAFATLFVSATVFWIVGFRHVWVCAIIFGVVLGGLTPLFYFAKFKPDKKAIAKRIDELGLEERILTMTQLEGDDSFIAKKQRADALAALNTVNAALIPMAISLPLILATAISGVAGATMTTLSVLASINVIPDGGEILNPTPEVVLNEYEVVYEVEEGAGEIFAYDSDEDGAFQIVIEGDDAAPVIAVPDDGWAFVQWSDGSEDPYRQDFNITENLTITAIFMELEEGEGGEGEGEPGEGEGDPGKPGEGEPGDGDNDSDEKGEGAGGKYEPSNQVIDGETYYGGSVYEGAYDSAVEEMDKNGDISEDEKDFIGGYWEGIRK